MTYAHLSVDELRAALALPSIGDVAKDAMRAELAERTTPATRHAEKRHVPLEAPLHLVVSFDALESDNKRSAPLGAAKRRAGQKYAEARARFRQQLRDQYEGEPVTEAVSIHAAVWFPDLQARDVINYAKIIGDSLKGIVIADDRWPIARRNTQEGAGVDVDRPRCVISIEPYVRADAVESVPVDGTPDRSLRTLSNT